MKKLILFAGAALAIIAVLVIGFLVLAVGAGAFFFLTTGQGEGLSYENAIVIEASNEDQGIAMEYEWLDEHGCEGKEGIAGIESQALEKYNESLYDLLTVNCGNGETLVYYFQIDSFFGIWE